MPRAFGLDDPNLLVYLYMGLAGGLGWALSRPFTQAARIRRQLRALPLTPIAQIEGGEARVKVVGRVIPIGTPLEAPDTERPCVHYRQALSHTHDPIGAGGGIGSGRSLTTTHERAQDFVLRDATGSLLVRLERAQVAMAKPTYAGQRFLFRHTEWLIEPNDEIAVCGYAHREPDPEPPPNGPETYREPPTRWVLTAHGDQPLLIAVRKTEPSPP